jgi:hypothetical protein
MRRLLALLLAAVPVCAEVVGTNLVIRPGASGTLTFPAREAATAEVALLTFQAQLPDADRRRLYLWLDANVPFYGTYDHAQQLAQREGRSVPVPPQ